MRRLQSSRGFTLVELLVVLVIILILAGLVLAAATSVIKNSRKSRATSELAAIQLALTRFEVDNSFYPQATSVTTYTNSTNAADFWYAGDPGTDGYKQAGRALFLAVTGRTGFDSTNVATDPNARQYLELQESQVADGSSAGTAGLAASEQATYTNSFNSGSYLKDPFGNAYGYYYNAGQEPVSLQSKTIYDAWSTVSETNTNAASRERWVHSWK